jgi:hypothetical protein
VVTLHCADAADMKKNDVCLPAAKLLHRLRIRSCLDVGVVFALIHRETGTMDSIACIIPAGKSITQACVSNLRQADWLSLIKIGSTTHKA